jgi:beta-1,4-mannosyltransferase
MTGTTTTAAVGAEAGGSDAGDGRALRVLTTRGGDDLSANPYVSTLAAHNDALLQVREFTWARALLGRFDVIHLHWPEALVRSPSRWKHAGKLALFRLLIALDRLRRRAHVSTIHNLTPHESGSPAEDAVLRAWLASCAVRIYLTHAGLAEAGDERGVVIPHGDYAEYVRRHRPAGPAAPAAAPTGRLLLFGMLRRYKGIERLVEAFGEIGDGRGLRLLVAGKAIDADYERLLGELAAARPGVEVRADHFLGHDELIGLIEDCEVVVLPYERMYNSGAALMALTVGRPVAATDSPSMAELRAEFGAEWIQPLPAQLTPEALTAAVDALRSSPRAALPDWSARSWPAIAAAHRDAYQRAVSAVRAVRGAPVD